MSATPSVDPQPVSGKRGPGRGSLIALVLGIVVGGAIALAVWAVVRDGDQSARASGTTAVEATAAAPATVSPQAGSAVASAETQLSFRGASVEQIGGITVEGSKSGRHEGRVQAHSDGQGASFLPAEPFEEGETVTVEAGFDVVGAKDRRYTMKIAEFAPLPKPGNTKRGKDPEVLTFRSRPDLQVPKLDVYTHRKNAAEGSLFLAPKQGAVPGGPMIVDGKGELVWFRPVTGSELTGDFRAQHYRGQPVLTHWQGTSSAGEGHGYGVIRDQHYNVIKKVHGGNGYSLDLHEFLLTPRGTALVTIYQPLEHDLRKFGGPEDGTVVDGIVQEIDIATGLVIFEWHSLDHVGLEEGTSNRPSESGKSRFDYFHINSIDEDVDGGLVVSARRTDAVYKINRRTGEVEWRLGGNRSDFKLGKGVEFFLQHDARVQSDGSIRIFDNSSEPEGGRSRDITVALNHERGTATLVRDVGHPRTKLFAATQGNAQPLPDGGILLGWGSQGRVSDVGPKGKLRFDAELPDGFDSYRFYKGPWVGLPETSPRLAVEAIDGDQTAVYASFNGATEVARWEVLAGDSDDALQPVATASRSGFETRITVPGRPQRVAVRALDADGTVLGTAKPIAGAQAG